MAKRMMQGSEAVAEMVAMCRPQVISAYPITPQTLIVEELSQYVADGKLKAEFVNVESEHSAASLVLGASATGVRVYSATTSQGLLLMTEVLYNIAGMRLPVVITCVNRAVSAPLNIWNDQQDSISVRDSGWIQLYAETNQEAMDLVAQAYCIAEDHRIMLPVMVCMDGYILTHAYEVVDVPDQEEIDAFVPPFEPLYYLDPAHPITMGAYADPEKYTEARYMMHHAMNNALPVIDDVAGKFRAAFKRPSGGLVEEYRMEDASTVVVAMGSVVGTIKDAVDELRAQGEKVGVLKVITYRPFPKETIYRALKKAQNVIVMEKAISLGSGLPLTTEIRSAFQSASVASPRISGVVAGLGGRDIRVKGIKSMIAAGQERLLDTEFLDLRHDLELEGVN